MWDLPRPGIDPMSPALADGFLTTEPSGKSPISVSLLKIDDDDDGDDDDDDDGGGGDVILRVRNVCH